MAEHGQNFVQPSIPIGVKGSSVSGTFGCFLRKGNKMFALTNSHVVGQTPNVDIAVGGRDFVIGKAKSGAVRSPGAGVDAAVVEVSEAILSSDKNYSILFPDNQTRIVGQARATVGMDVWFWGATNRRKQQGRVVNINATTTIRNTKWGHLIAFDSARCPEGGDSGSVLVNDDNEVVGLVFAAEGEQQGYACHIDAVFDALSNTYGKGVFTFP